MKSSNDWFSPANLERLARNCESVDHKLLSQGGDFSAYAKVNRGNSLTDSGIENHNYLYPIDRVRLYRELVGRETCEKIADLGCGLGFTSAALSEIFCTSRVTGYEISLDAVQYASKKWPRIKFIAEAVHGNSRLSEQFDLVIAQEFYPFTRTSDWDVHKSYISTILCSLRERGTLLIGMAEGRETIMSNVKRLDYFCRRFNAHCSLHYLPFLKVYSLVRSYFWASLFSWIIHQVTRKKRFCVLKVTLLSSSTF